MEKRICRTYYTAPIVSERLHLTSSHVAIRRGRVGSYVPPSHGHICGGLGSVVSVLSLVLHLINHLVLRFIRYSGRGRTQGWGTKSGFEESHGATYTPYTRKANNESRAREGVGQNTYRSSRRLVTSRSRPSTTPCISTFICVVMGDSASCLSSTNAALARPCS